MANDFKEAMGMRVKLLRNIRGYSREEVAFQASISVKFLYEVEKGKIGISAEKLVKLAKILNVSCDYLLTGTVPKIANIMEQHELEYIEKITCNANEKCK
ncbi:MAG: helix-turn-helix transcriptional regulator [Lachnospiraceae bacterium]|nr:helix-turn-helix transcriptional regulator [Lachnospiraceae bacterium]